MNKLFLKLKPMKNNTVNMILMTFVCFHYQVSIGNLRMSLGRLSLIHQERLNLTGNKTLIPSVLILFFFVLLTIGIICMKKSRIGPFKRKIIHHESSVVFHADSAGQQISRRLMPDPDPESSTSARLNGNESLKFQKEIIQLSNFLIQGNTNRRA